MSFRPAAALLAAAFALPQVACTPMPPSAAVTRCTTPLQQQRSPWQECTLRVDRFDGRTSTGFHGKSPRYYRHFEAEADFRIERGRVTVTVRGGGEPVVFVVEPGKPWRGRIVAPLEYITSKRRRFTILMEPEGDASGLDASIRHRHVSGSSKTPVSVVRADGRDDAGVPGR